MSEQNTFIVSPEIRHLLVCIGLIGIDQWSKSFPLFNDLPITTYNSGISFGIFRDWPYEVVLALSICAVVALLFVFRKAAYNVLADYPYLAIVLLAGGLSNIIDRILYGGVRDWLPIPFMGIYNNLADWYISIAVITMIVLELKALLKASFLK